MRYRLFLCAVFLFIVMLSSGGPSLWAQGGLPDGFLGLGKAEVHNKLGEPKYYYMEEIPYRRYWMFPVEDVDKMKERIWSQPTLPKDEVFPIERDGKRLLYRIQYAWDKRSEVPQEKARKYWVYLKESPVELKDLVAIVPEFSPAHRPDVLTFQHRQVSTNRVVVTFLLPEVSELAGVINSNFQEPVKGNSSLSYQVILCNGEEEISLKSKVCEVIVEVGSQEMIARLKKPLGFKDVINPFSS